MITLINTPSSATNTMNVGVKNTQLTPHLGLLYLAANLEKNGFNVKVIDAPAENMAIEDCINASKGSELAAISANTVSYLNAKELISKLHSLGIKTVIGGYQPTIVPEFVMKDTIVDILVVGEGEDTLVEIANNKEPCEIKGIFYRDNGNIKKTQSRPLRKNLDVLPFPLWNVVKGKNYGWLGKIFRVCSPNEFGVLLTSRGCPHNCSFCSASALYNHTYRRRSLKSVMEEIEFLRSMGRDKIYIQDDNFCVDTKFVTEFCKAIKPLDIEWFCLMRVDADTSLYQHMRKSGCDAVFYGFESSSQKILDYFNKSTTQEQQICAIRHAKRNNLFTTASYIFGAPPENLGDIEENIRVSTTSGVDIIEPNILTVFPGTGEWTRQCKNQVPNRGYSVEELGNRTAETYMNQVFDKFYKRKYHLIKAAGGVFLHHNRIFRENIGNISNLLSYIYDKKDRESICEGYPKRCDY